MEPRPQRPRTPASSTGQGNRPRQPGQEPPAGYAGDPTAFVAPQRTEYDYSPLDLAPPGQRRRRQFVAAAVGALSVLLLGAIIFFSYLLLRDEDPPDQNDDLLAAQTQIANDEATLAANQTVVAQAAAEQTEAAAALNPESTEAPADATEQPASTDGEDPAATEQAPPQETPPADDAAAQGGQETPAAPDLSGNASLDEAGLEALLPTADQVPAALTDEINTTRTREQVVESLGGGRPAEANLEDWGWTGNVDRAFQVADPAAADPASTTYLGVSIHGFGSPAATEAALPFFADILVTGGYTELEAPDIGDEAQMLSLTNEDGTTTVYLYVRQGSVLYRILGSSPGGDPAQDVMALANALIEG
jgi:hypothetical protein